MARFRLLSSHILDVQHASGWIPVQFDAGYEFDAGERPSHWVPSPYMAALDPEAEAWINQSCSAWAEHSADGTLIGFGPVQSMPFTEADMGGVPTWGDGGPPPGSRSDDTDRIISGGDK